MNIFNSNDSTKLINSSKFLPRPSILGASTKISSVFFTNILSPTLGLSKINRCPLATAISEILALGHHATLLTISPVSIVLIQRPVEISQTIEKLKNEILQKIFYRNNLEHQVDLLLMV